MTQRVAEGVAGVSAVERAAVERFVVRSVAAVAQVS